MAAGFAEMLENTGSMIELHEQETRCYWQIVPCILEPPDISTYLSLIPKSAMCINLLVFLLIEHHVRSVLGTSHKEADSTGL